MRDANYKNPLHDYIEYTYHFILMMTKDPSSLDKFTEITDIDTFNHPPVDKGGKYQPKSMGGTDYIVIFNSMTDAEFYIEKLEIESWLKAAPIQSKQDFSGQTQLLSLNIDIIEYLTLDFIPVIQHCAKKLNTSVQDATLMIKIIFSGVPNPVTVNDPKPPGQDNIPVHILNTPVISFKILAISMTITQAGARYLLETFTAANSKPVLEHYGKVGPQKLTVTSRKLKDIFNELTQELNRSRGRNVESLTDPKKYNIINYKIDLDSDYDNYTYDTKQTNDFGGTKNGSFQVASNSDTLTGVIHDILMNSPEIQRDLVIKDVNGKNERYIPEVSATLIYDKDTGEYTYYIKIVRTQDLIVPETQNNEVIEFYRSHDAFFEYDYIYTGKNLDILRMDLNVPFSAAYLYSGISHTPYNPINPTETKKSGPEAYGTSKPKDTSDIPTGTNQDLHVNTNNSERADASGNRPIIPLFNQSDPYGSNLPSNVPNGSLYAAARRSLTEHLNQTIIKNEMEIVGDPQLLFGLLYKQLMTSTTKTVAEYKQAMKQVKPDTVMVSPDVVTGLVKINVRAPKPKFDNINNIPTDSPEEPTEYENKFSTQFWYEGLYVVNKIQSIFTHGAFTQVLYLTSQSRPDHGYNVKPYKTASNEKTQKPPMSRPKKSRTGYKEQPVVPYKGEYKQGVSSKEYTKSPEFQQKLRDLDKKYGYPDGYMNALMTQESHGNPDAYNEGSGAMGAFQFLKGTAKEQGVSNPFDPDQAAEGAAKYIDNIRDRNPSWDLETVTRAYNSGPGAMRQIQGGTRQMKAETYNYTKGAHWKGIL